MSCSNPLLMFVASDGSQHWHERAGFDFVGVRYVPCSKCAMCRRTRAADWSTRLYLESYVHARSACLTLTVAPEHLWPVGTTGSLVKRHVELFLKRLRDEALRRDGSRVRFDVLAEYSPEAYRPHYHIAAFGWWPADARRWAKSQAGNQEFVSETLSRLWPYGHATFQEFSSGAAAYIARHNSWKLTGQLAPDGPLMDATGAVVGVRLPEFHWCSRKPGIGAGFFDRHSAQLLACDFTVVDGSKVPLPRYFLRRGEGVDPGRVSELRAAHEVAARLAMPDATRERLAVREECALASLRRNRRDGV